MPPVLQRWQAALGVTGIFLLLLAVNVVLGPCLTLVFDLVVIVVLQAAALVLWLMPLERLANYNPTATLEPVLANHPQADSWLPLSTTHQDMVVLINKEQGEVVALVDLRPWYAD